MRLFSVFSPPCPPGDGRQALLTPRRIGDNVARGPDSRTVEMSLRREVRMSTAISTRSKRPDPERAAKREARRSRIAQGELLAIESEAVRQAFLAMLGAAGGLIHAGRFDDAGALLSTVLERVLRIHFRIVTGHEGPPVAKVTDYVMRLRSAGALDKTTHRALSRIVGMPLPYDERYVRELWQTTRQFCQMTFLPASLPGSRPALSCGRH
jgi:hypothetical protein